MARVALTELKDLEGKAKEAYAELEANNKVTNMKKALLNDYATYDAFMAWYTSWARLVEVVGERAATIYAHSVSTTNGCLLCSLFFISDLKALGIDPDEFEMDDTEAALAELGAQIVKDPTAVSDELIGRLKEKFNDSELTAIVGFACQMIATNNFNSVMRIDVDERLIPIKDEFKPATWRENIQ